MAAAVAAFELERRGYKTTAARFGVDADELKAACQQKRRAAADAKRHAAAERKQAKLEQAAAKRAKPAPSRARARKAKPPPRGHGGDDLPALEQPVPERVNLSRIEFLELEIEQLSVDIAAVRRDGKAHHISYRQLRGDLARHHAELTELREAEALQRRLAQGNVLSALTPEERRARLRTSAMELPEDLLQVFVGVFLERHHERVQLLVAGAPWCPPWAAAEAEA